MRDYSRAMAMNLVWRTAPFMLLRIAVYLSLLAGLVLACLAGATIGWSIGAAGGSDMRAPGTNGGAAVAALLYLLSVARLRHHLFYLVKAGHIAALVALIDREQVPSGRRQIGFAATRVHARLRSARVVRALDLATAATIRAITGLVQGVLSPLPRNRILRRLHRVYLDRAVGLMDEVVLAQSLRQGMDNPWAGARVALVLYAQTARPMLLNAARLTLPSWAAVLALFLLALGPAQQMAAILPGAWAGETALLAAVGAWAGRSALVDPFVLACLLQAYIHHTDSAQPNRDWEDKLDSAAEAFHEMGRKATAWSGHPDPLARTGGTAPRNGETV